MSKQITLTLRLTLENLSEEEIREQAELCGMDPEDFADGVEEVDAFDLADGISTLLTESEVQQEYIWAGSNLYAQITACEVVSAA